MVMLRYLAAALALISSLGLPSCGLFESDEVTLCQEAMKMHADQLGAPEEAKPKFINGCIRRAGIHTRDQWQCIIAEMKQGKAYVEAGNACGSK